MAAKLKTAKEMCTDSWLFTWTFRGICLHRLETAQHLAIELHTYMF